MRIATPFASLGRLLLLCATLVYAHQPTALARAGLEKRVHPSETLWTQLANEAESTVKELANSLGFQFPPATNHNDEQTLQAQNKMSNLNIAGSATANDEHGEGSSALNNVQGNRRSSSWSRSYPPMDQVVKLDGPQPGERLAHALVVVRDTIFKLLEAAPKPFLGTEPFLNHFRTAAHAYEELDHAYRIYRIQHDHQPRIWLSSLLEPKMGWQAIRTACIEVKRGEKPWNIAALAEEGSRVLTTAKYVVHVLKSTIGPYQRLFPEDPAIDALKDLAERLNEFILAEEVQVDTLVWHNSQR